MKPVACVLAASLICTTAVGQKETGTGKPTTRKTEPTEVGKDAPAQQARERKVKVTIEYIAHACFRIKTPDRATILIDPYASLYWLGYRFPKNVGADEIFITHPHYDHDGGTSLGRKFPFAQDIPVRRVPGSYTVGKMRITGIAGRHARDYGKAFGHRNTIWRIKVGGLNIVHLGDNGPLTPKVIRRLGQVDILMIPIDGQYHLLTRKEIEAICKALKPRVLIPMHYRIPELEPGNRPRGLGPIDPWLKGRKNVVRLKTNRKEFSAKTLPAKPQILVFRHSPKVRRPKSRRK